MISRLVLVLGLALAAPLNSAMASFTKIVDTYTVIPGSTQTFSFNISDVPAISQNRVVFVDGNQTVWVGYANGSGLTPLITTKTPIPGIPGATFRQYFGTTVQIENGTVVVLGDSCGGCGAGVGLYAFPAAGLPVTGARNLVKTLADTTTLGHPFPMVDFHLHDRQVVFQNNGAVYDVPVTGGVVTPVAGLQDSDYSPPTPYCCIFNSPDVAGNTVVVRAGNVFGRGSIQTVDRSGDPLSFRVLANAANGFDEFELRQPLIDGGRVVFRGKNLTNTVDAIYSTSATGGSIVTLVDTNTPVPGGTGNFQSNGGFEQIVARGGVVVFRGRDAAQRLGLYRVNETGGGLAKIIAYGDPIGAGFTVGDVSIGAGALGLGPGGVKQLAFSVSYQGFLGGGMYQINLP